MIETVASKNCINPTSQAGVYNPLLITQAKNNE